MLPLFAIKGGFTRWPEFFIVTCVHRGGSRDAATSKMECFMVILNGWKPLTIIKKHSILDVAAVLDPPLILGCSSTFHWAKSHDPFSPKDSIINFLIVSWQRPLSHSICIANQWTGFYMIVISLRKELKGSKYSSELCILISWLQTPHTFLRKSVYIYCS